MNENEQKNYLDSKVYYDGSHYIAIPQGSYPSGKGCKRRHTARHTPEQIERKEQFETAYKESRKLPRKQRDKFLDERLKDTIPDDTKRKDFIAENIIDITRRIKYINKKLEKSDDWSFG